MTSVGTSICIIDDVGEEGGVYMYSVLPRVFYHECDQPKTVDITAAKTIDIL
jgi:hypothetical protein